jgi:HlyD family secretion protein
MQKIVVRLIGLAILVAVSIGGWWWWQTNREAPLPDGIALGNGRIQADRVDVAVKFAGRIDEVVVREGDLVQPGQLLARMDTNELEAMLAQAKAQLAEVEQSVEQAIANIARAQSDLELAEQQLERGEKLLLRNAISESEYESQVNTVSVARATLGANQAALRTQQFAVDAAEARVRQIQTQLDDAVLKSPVRGRVLYRLAEPGEVLNAGGKVVTMLDLNEIYVETYVTAATATRLQIGSEARVVVDVAPNYAARAKVTFVAPEAQFTPKEVETRGVREDLMFRIKVRFPPEQVEPYLERIKTGIRAVVYVRFDPQTPWPDFLQRPFPDDPLELDDPSELNGSPGGANDETQ